MKRVVIPGTATTGTETWEGVEMRICLREGRKRCEKGRNNSKGKINK